MLTHVVRQAGTLKRNCTAILDGYVEPTCKPKEKGAIPWQVVRSLTETLTCKRHLVDGFKQILESRPTADIIHGIQILSPQKKGDLGCDALNVELQRVVQKVKWGVDVEPVSHGKGKRPAFYVNDKVIQTKNDYNLDVMNGTLGQIVGIGPFFDPETREEIANTKDALKIQFEGRNRPVIVEKDKRINVSLAYALTIHKCQGSEFPMVLLVIHKAHNFMHTRNLLYTGATRAKKKLIVMGDKWGISNCASKVAVDLRKTWLSELLKRCA